MEPNETQNVPTATVPKKSPSYGGLIAILIILAAVVIGAFYFWGERIAKEPQTPEQELQNLEQQDTSTDSTSIETDLNAQSPDDFDKELDEAFAEMEASFDAQ